MEAQIVEPGIVARGAGKAHGPIGSCGIFADIRGAVHRRGIDVLACGAQRLLGQGVAIDAGLERGARLCTGREGHGQQFVAQGIDGGELVRAGASSGKVLRVIEIAANGEPRKVVLFVKQVVGEGLVGLAHAADGSRSCGQSRGAVGFGEEIARLGGIGIEDALVAVPVEKSVCPEKPVVMRGVVVERHFLQVFVDILQRLVNAVSSISVEADILGLGEAHLAQCLACELMDAVLGNRNLDPLARCQHRRGCGACASLPCRQ